MNVINGQARVGDTYMDYISFGSGEMPLVILPGLSTRGLKGLENTLAELYSLFANEYRVYFLDRKHDVPEGYSVTDMADDTVEAMRTLGIERACLLGVSQGGMIAQAIAAKYPDMTEKLVLGSTLARQNATINAAITNWIGHAERGDYQSLNRESFIMLYSDQYLKDNNLLSPITIAAFKPENLSKFIILAKACLTFDGYDNLDKMKCPVLVLGAKNDKVTSGRASEEIAEKLNCEIYMYEEYGHAVYDEAEDYKDRIYSFLRK